MLKIVVLGSRSKVKPLGKMTAAGVIIKIDAPERLEPAATTTTVHTVEGGTTVSQTARRGIHP